MTPATLETPVSTAPVAMPAPEAPAEARPKELLIIDYSGDLEKIWATMILASTSGAMGVKTRASLKLIPFPPCSATTSFAFDRLDDFVAACG